MSGLHVPAVGAVIASKYRVESQLGAGGMGVVLAATHVDLGNLVAIKVMRPESSRGHAKRFHREARVVAKLHSEHVARVLDYGQLEDGSPFVVMDYLRGRDLDAELKARGPLPVEEAVEHALSACEALAEAHAFGVVHRDVKPKNLFLARMPGGVPVLKVLDFGLAKIGAEADPSITGSQDIFGSPTYMAPEQMRSTKDVDARADIWALGVTLYELLAGEGPFEAASVAEVCALVLKEPPPPLRAKRAEVSAELAKVVHRCLEKKAEDRFQSMLELARALEPFAPARRGASERIQAIIDEPRTNPSLPPLGRGGVDSGSESPTLVRRGNSEELTLEMETQPTGRLGVTRQGSDKRSRSSLVLAGVVVAVGGVGALIATRANDQEAHAPPVPATLDTARGPSAPRTEEAPPAMPSASSTGVAPREATSAALAVSPSTSATVKSRARPAPARASETTGANDQPAAAAASPAAANATATTTSLPAPPTTSASTPAPPATSVVPPAASAPPRRPGDTL